MLLAAALALLASPAALAEGWSLTITPYAWGARQHGNHVFDQHTVNFDDSLDPFRGGGFVRLRAARGRWSIFSEITSPTLELEIEDTFFIAHDNHFRSLELGAGYRVTPTLDLLVGARETRVSIFEQVPWIRGLIITTDRETEVVEPFLGAGWTAPLAGRWGLEGRVDVGGFGVGSELSWNAEAMVRYDMGRRWSALAGYRVIEVDFEEGRDGLYWDTQLPGLVLGLRLALLDPEPATPLAQPDPAPSTEPDGWRATVGAYAWGAGFSGRASLQDLLADDYRSVYLTQRVDHDDVADPFSDHGFWRLEIGRGRWALLLGRGVYDVVRQRLVNRTELTYTRLELLAAYRLGRGCDLIVGARRSELVADVSVIETPLTEARTYAIPSEWTEPILGARWRPRLGRRWALESRVDVGGFGIDSGSELTWNVESLLVFEAHRRVSLAAGFRVLDVDFEERILDEYGYRATRIIWEAQLPGAVAGLRLHF